MHMSRRFRISAKLGRRAGTPVRSIKRLQAEEPWCYDNRSIHPTIIDSRRRRTGFVCPAGLDQLAQGRDAVVRDGRPLTLLDDRPHESVHLRVVREGRLTGQNLPQY